MANPVKPCIHTYAAMYGVLTTKASLASDETCKAIRQSFFSSRKREKARAFYNGVCAAQEAVREEYYRLQKEHENYEALEARMREIAREEAAKAEGK
jgi:hypothetical protein